MRELGNIELMQVVGGGKILLFGGIGLTWAISFLTAGPAGLGAAIAATVAGEGIRRLDQLEAQHQIDVNSSSFNHVHYDSSNLISYGRDFG